MSSVLINPAKSSSGIVFHSMNDNGSIGSIPVSHENLTESSYRTGLSKGSCSVETIEHLLAALCACGVDNAAICVTGNELPILDGCSESWTRLILDAGLERQDHPRIFVRILKKIEVVDDNGASCSLTPCDGMGMSLCYNLEYQHPLIGCQTFEFDLDVSGFLEEIAPARTFGFLKDIPQLRKLGLANGANLSNTLVFDDSDVVNDDGLKWTNEPARHKILDAIGDLSIIGGPIIGRFDGYRSGHRLNHKLLSMLLSDDTAWQYETGA